uniref:Uncharacterized protein n=1 Tax=Oryza barthii TaxID=65489 RepID=A0A0D3F800_9ORYZ
MAATKLELQRCQQIDSACGMWIRWRRGMRGIGWRQRCVDGRSDGTDSCGQRSGRSATAASIGPSIFPTVQNQPRNGRVAARGASVAKLGLRGADLVTELGLRQVNLAGRGGGGSRREGAVTAGPGRRSSGCDGVRSTDPVTAVGDSGMAATKLELQRCQQIDSACGMWIRWRRGMRGIGWRQRCVDGRSDGTDSCGQRSGRSATAASIGPSSVGQEGFVFWDVFLVDMN